MGPTINLGSLRAAQARFAIVISSKLWRALLGLLIILFVAAGVGLWYLHSPFVWFVAGLAAWPLTVLLWYSWWLADLPPAKNATTIDGLLEGAVLGRLKNNATPQQLAEVVMHTNGGLFFAVRLGIGPNFLRELSSANPAEMTQIWQTAQQMREQHNLTHISSAVLTASLVAAMPTKDKLLAQLQLTYNDVLAGVRWYHHLHDLIAASKKLKIGGGLGRDLSFGFTPTLQQFARNVSNEVGGGTLARKLEGHNQILDQLFQQLSKGGRQNAVLVGQNGVGKTTLVYSFAERLLRDDPNVPADLRYRQVMMLDPAGLIARARRPGELEALLNRILVEAHTAKNVILFLDNAEMFFGEGTGTVDLRNVLLPVLEGGALRMILSMDEQQWLKLSRATPSLTQQLNRIMVAPLTEADTLLVCEDQLLGFEFTQKVTYMYQSLRTAYRLGQRYVADQAMPGQALSVLRAAAQFATNGIVTSASVEKAVEQTAGVKISTARQGDERDMLLHLEDLLHKRMINQTRAVGVVANALRRARSGVRNQNRPIGSFLFLGPTGVGKTELAKALAAVYFGGEDHIVRLDLNEFGQATDVTRLIADGATDARSLTAQIAKQPFSVVLLDEIEKAHPNVLNTLLQLLDEGILRDTNNRDISFRDAIIIATSNAGADRIRQYIDAGYQLEQFEQQFTNELIDNGQFKPEFLNRFDEITLFRPLTEDELMQVVDLMLAGVNSTLATQQLKVEVDTQSKRKLVQVGADPRLGARPLRRVVQRTVENIVAKEVLAGHVSPGQTITINLAAVEQALATNS
jgi:ATP-dependent Clp protease ATP-binding subunit ClpC